MDYTVLKDLIADLPERYNPQGFTHLMTFSDYGSKFYQAILCKGESGPNTINGLKQVVWPYKIAKVDNGSAFHNQKVFDYL